MLKKTHKSRDLLPIIIFGALFVASIVLYFFWYDPIKIKIGDYDFYLIATFWLQPLIIISGASIILYVVELFGFIKAKRNKTLSIVLLVLIFVLMILVFIMADPMKVHLRLFVLFKAIIIYEIMGLGLFLAIGPKQCKGNKNINGELLIDE